MGRGDGRKGRNGVLWWRGRSGDGGGEQSRAEQGRVMGVCEEK